MLKQQDLNKIFYKKKDDKNKGFKNRWISVAKMPGGIMPTSVLNK